MIGPYANSAAPLSNANLRLALKRDMDALAGRLAWKNILGSAKKALVYAYGNPCILSMKTRLNQRLHGQRDKVSTVAVVKQDEGLSIQMEETAFFLLSPSPRLDKPVRGDVAEWSKALPC